MRGIPHVPLDSIFWEPGGYNRKRTELEIEAELKKIQGSGCWLVEGVFGHIVDQLFSFADTMIRMDIPWDECRKNLMSRGSESSRQLDPLSTDKNFISLLEWASAYETRDSKASKKYHCFLYETFSGAKHRVCSRDEADRLLEKIRANHSLDQSDAKSG